MNATESRAASAALPIMDAVATQIIALAAPMRFGVAQSAVEREAAYRLRYRVVIERGWAQPEDLPDGLERDAYDDIAVHIVGWDRDVLAATARLVFPSPGHVLPTEEAFGLEIEPRGQIVDMGRQIVARAYSNVQHRVFGALLAQTWLEARARGFFYVCGDLTPAMIRLYRLLGLQISILAPARRYWGEERHPILLDVPGSASALLKRYLNDNRE